MNWNSLKFPLIIGLIALTAAVGTLLYLSNFTIYLGSDPSTCNNCHVMDGVYESWYHSSHRAWTTCSDCHAPHALVPKYLFKAYSGARDVAMFTVDYLPSPLRAEPLTRDILQENCVRCHEETVSMIADGQKDSGRYCVDCHRSIPHGDRGISLLPYQDTGIYDLSEVSEED